MMNRNQTTHRSRLLAAMVSLLMLVVCTFTALPAHAANVPPADNLSFTFNKYLVLNKGTKVPPVTFDFTIAAGQAVAANGSRVIYAGNDAQRTNGKLPVLKVESAGTDQTASVTFASGDTTWDRKQGQDTVMLAGEKMYARKSVTVDFAGVSFKAPGIYRYVITESATTQDGIVNDTTTTRTLDVFVEYETGSDNELKISNYILYPGTKTNSSDEATKDDGFTNTYTSYALTLEKTVTGNQGDRDQYFKFTVDITSLIPGTVYAVDVTTNAEAFPTVHGTSQTNPDTITAGTAATYYLKHDQSIVIRGLTAKTQYTVTEESYSADGYTTSYVLDSEQPVESNTTGAKTMGAADHTVTFTNNKTGVVPTGILLDVAPYLLLVAAALAGFALLALGGKRRNRR